MKTLINFWLDFCLLVVFLALIWVATIVRFVFPTPVDTSGWSLWGGTYQAWADLQFGLLATLTLLILIHVMLHWNWICGVVGSRLWKHRDGSKRVIDEGMRTIYGVGLMIVVLNLMGVAIAAAVLTVQGPA